MPNTVKADSAQLLCVCGHPEGWHGSLSKMCYGGSPGTPNADRCDCQCRKFRVALPWPDSEGWWWLVSKDPDFGAEDVVRAYERFISPDSGIYIIYKLNHYHQRVFLDAVGEPLFTKCEPNPFAANGGKK